MSGPDPKHPDDSLLDDFLAGRSEVSRAYRAASDESAPSSLDAPVLQMARVAAARPRMRRWRMPMAAAAVLLLSFGSLELIREEPSLRRATLMEAERPVVAMSAPEVPEAQADMTAEPERESMTGGASVMAGQPAATALAKQKAEAHASLQAEGRQREREEQAGLRKKIEAGKEAASTVARSGAAAATAPPIPPPPAAAAGVAPMRAAPVPAEPAPASAPALKPAPAASRGRFEAAPAMEMEMEAQNGESKAAAVQDRIAAGRAPEALSPEQWLQTIRELLAAGKRGPAAEQLRQLHLRHPNLELPPDLRELLPAEPVRPAGRP